MLIPRCWFESCSCQFLIYSTSNYFVSTARNVACDSKNRLVVIDRSGLATVYNGDRKQVLQFPVAPREQGTVDPRCVAIDKEDRIYIGKLSRSFNALVSFLVLLWQSNLQNLTQFNSNHQNLQKPSTNCPSKSPFQNERQYNLTWFEVQLFQILLSILGSIFVRIFSAKKLNPRNFTVRKYSQIVFL